MRDIYKTILKKRAFENGEEKGENAYFHIVYYPINSFLTDDVKEAFVDSVHQDHTAQNMQSDL